MTDTTHTAVVEVIPAAPAPAPAPRRTRAWRGVTPWLFLIAPLALLITFTYAPIVNMLAYSFTDWDGVSPVLHYTGAENYREVFTRPDLFEVFWVSGYYLAASAVQIVLALYFATVLSFDVRFRNFFKGVLFFPYLVNGVAIGFVFLYFFQDGGTLDSVLSLFGVHTDHAWLGTPASANTSLAGVSVWRYLGLNFVLFLGAIQSIPGELYEAAELDGAGRWQQFRHIIAPGIKPVLTLTVILSVSGSLSVFEIPYIMTGGATGTETFVIQTVNLAFRFNKTGLASAAAVVLLLIILLVTWVQRRLVPDDKVDLV
ncbi:multiple sugar transport system permease protein [Streptomyces sp. SAI-208]|uniref:carbohydrate ABC transporter permease n=1 Tax=unclassified Streptomyces TaxID=2593676 RepID=UPI002473F77F|nr:MULTISPECIES: sugar ABC transporter permease [unclassified Streptomyces]MDH6515856.1 multiple sugar transport system permease protein [Streptomyces sp. SAI-090]MDH6567157.1 multiple sugar transport system permease protein [Streptomyces sp. SAI-117]MDH6606684.1 multiple sugar transport system permease protein [Streptomyces sp. SAI-208]MDH6620060.1 multiple sugar transport system permease protein [Streptomyces sp. SAI-135]